MTATAHSCQSSVYLEVKKSNSFQKLRNGVTESIKPYASFQFGALRANVTTKQFSFRFRSRNYKFGIHKTVVNETRDRKKT